MEEKVFISLKTLMIFCLSVSTLYNDPEKIKSATDWKAAIGLQKVDGLTVPNYLYKLVARNIVTVNSHVLPRSEKII